VGPWIGGDKQDKSRTMRVLVYGGGSVGLGISSCLLKAQVEVDIVGRADTVEALRRRGLVRTGIFGQYQAGPEQFGSCCRLDELGGRRYEYVCVCTKSFDTTKAAEDLAGHRELLEDGAKIVLFQNGWGNAERFTAFFENERIYSARVITGFARAEKHHVVVTVHADAIHVGSLFGAGLEAVERLCEAIRAGDIPCETTDRIAEDLWAKMLYNCALNPLGAILRVPYGVLAEYQTTRSLMDAVVKEIFEVMRAADYKTHWRTAEQFLEVFYGRLVPATAEHKSSMLQSLEAGKRTEIDALNGAVVELGERHGMDVPYNRVLYEIVKFLEGRGR